MNILVQTGIDARARYIILLPHWEEITLNIFRGEEKHTGGECMLIWKWKQSKTHHDLQMPTCGKKISVGTERKSSKLQKMQNRAFEDEPVLNYKEHCKKHENHFISVVLFSTPLRCKTGLGAINSLLFVCLLDGYSQEWQLLFQHYR